MKRRIDFLMQFSKAYTYEMYVAKQLQRVFEENNVDCRMVSLSEGIFGHYLQTVYLDPPDWTLSFLDLFPGEVPLCDVTQVPHLCIPQRGLWETFPFLYSSQGHIGLSDEKLCLQLKAKGFSQVRYCPPAVDSTLKGYAEEHRCFDVVLFDDLIDVTCLKNTWREVFSDSHVLLLEEAIRLNKENQESTPFEILYELVQKKHLSYEDVPFSDLLFSFEEYLKAINTYEVINSLQHVRIDVFGEHVGNNWLKRLKNHHNVFLHWSLPYIEYLEVLKKSKILVRMQLPALDGADEWIFPALCCGCLPLTNKTPFLIRYLGHALETYSSLEELNSLVQRHLKNAFERSFVTETLTKTILPVHSWKTRARELLLYLL